MPFEIPNSWCWSRMSNVLIINPRNDIDDSLDVSFIPMTMIDDQFSNYHKSEIRKWSSIKSGFTHFKENDIGLAKITPCFENRKSVVMKSLVNGYGAGTTELHILRSIAETIIPEYILWFVKSEHFISNGKQAFSGVVGQQRVGKEHVSSALFPLPPYADQLKIVEAIGLAFKQIDTIEKEKSDLQSIIVQAKSKILELAIRGKLVPQDPNDEPASVLLERIRAEKEQLIKEGKIKRDKNESFIFRGEDKSYYQMLGGTEKIIDGQLPFDLPENWSWAKLEQINSYQGKTSTPLHFPKDKFELYSVPTFDTAYPEILSGFEIGSSKQIVTQGDILLCKINPRINRVWYVSSYTNNQTLASSEWIIIRCKLMVMQYLCYYHQSPYFRKMMLSNVSGVGGSLMRAQPNSVKKYFITIPPIAEQHRIVDAIESAFTQLGNITAVLS